MQHRPNRLRRNLDHSAADWVKVSLLKGSTVLVAIVCLGGCSSSPGRGSGVGAQGVKPAGGLCAGEADVAAYQAAKQYFLPGYPGALPSPGPSACYASARAAESDGYHAASTPLGAEFVGGVYLAPVSDEVRGACKAAALVMRGPLACPRILPTYPPISSKPICTSSSLSPEVGSDSACVVVEGFVMSWEGFAVPHDYVGVDGRAEGHLVVISAPQDRFVEALRCQGEVSEGTIVVNGITAARYSCPQSSGMQGGHVGVRWSADGVASAVSMHHDSATNRRLVQDIANSMQVVSQ